MALGSANAVSPMPAVDNTAKANISVATNGNGSGGTFTDSLEAVLAQPGAADGKPSSNNDNDSDTAAVSATAQSGLAKFKNRLKAGDLGVALTPQMLQQRQTIIRQLEGKNSGIDMPALRAAMGKDAQTPGQSHILPVLNPVTGKASTAQPGASTQADELAGAPSSAAKASTQAVPNTQDAPNTPAIAPSPVATKSVGIKTAGSDPSKSAAHAATQGKLVAALVKTAGAPVLKAGQAGGSAVPNAKIAQPAHAQKAKARDGATDVETAQSLAIKIAATAGATNDTETASAAAKGVAIAEVATRTTPAAPTVTKIETAAMANATQTATHATTPQAKIEAQALPVLFDVPANKSDSGDTGSRSGTGDKNPSQSGSLRTASDAPQQTNTANTGFEPQATAPAHADNSSATANAAAAANGNVATQVAPSHIATVLQVSQQVQHTTPEDQTTFAALGVAIAARSKDGEKQFDINMHPAELGRVDVRISVDSDGKAQAHLTAEHPQTLQLLQNDKATLERSLRDAGLDLSNNGLNFSLKGEQQSSTPTFNARSRALSIATVQTADISSSINAGSSIAPGDSRLDIRV